LSTSKKLDLVQWADQHLADIDTARAAYDRRSAALSASLNSHPEPNTPDRLQHKNN
jgi:hypothetical protein